MTDALAALFLSAEHHPEILFRAAAESLSAGRCKEAFALADRRCRIYPLASANHFLLRAATLRAIGEPEGAIENIRRALEIDPTHLVAHRAMLAGGSACERDGAARILLSAEVEPSRQAASVRVLAESHDAVGSVRYDAAAVTGFFVWRGGPALPLEVTWDCMSDSVVLHADEAHPLRNALGHAASWSSRWREGAERLHLTVPRGIIVGSPLWNPTMASPEPGMSPRHPDGRRAVAVLVPVYDDCPATQACLESLLDDKPARVSRRVVVIDDATPVPAIAAMLHRLSEEGRIELLRNPYNRGFARSINRALHYIRDEDVLLLNADTVVPKGFLDKLSLAAYSAPDIGTVTPLSNNGEYTSVPHAFRANGLPGCETVQMISDAAGVANGTAVVDLPNGIGFCLYIRRDCLDQVGTLSHAFDRGYYEDVEFCLRASARGWRNVCAPGIYVGHAGARSFRSEKPALVSRGAAIVDRIHADYARASSAFVANDPLSAHRQALERELMPALGPFDLAVIPEPTGSDWRELVPPVRDGGRRRLAALVNSAAGRITIRLHQVGGGFPQNLVLSHLRSDALQGLQADFERMTIAGIDVFDPKRLPDEVLKVVLRLGRPISIWIRDLSVLCRSELTSGTGRRTCEVCAGECPCDLEPLPQAVEAERGVLEEMTRRAQTVVLPDEETLVVFRRSLPAANTVTASCSRTAFTGPNGRRNADPLRLGVIIDPESENSPLLIAIAERFARSPSSPNLAVIGSTSDDFHLMRTGPAFVTGPVQREELRGLLGGLGVARLLFPSRRICPSHYLLGLCRTEKIPTARFRWSIRQSLVQSEGDLEMPAATPTSVVAELVLRWLTGDPIA